MRNPDRIEHFLDEIGKVWREKFPDWRFGQLMYNFFSVLGDPFYYEEDEFLEALKAYSNRENPKEAVKRYREQKMKNRKLDSESTMKYKDEIEAFFKSFDFAAFQEKLKKEMKEKDEIKEMLRKDDLK